MKKEDLLANDQPLDQKEFASEVKKPLDQKEFASEVKIAPIPKPPDILIAYKSGIFVGHTLDGRFLITHDLSESKAADEGGIGLVYLAQDLKLLGKNVVVKILRQASLDDPDLSRKFQHEKEALIRLDHPNIVRILDSGTLTDGNPYLVMEFIQGYSLRRVLEKQEKLPLEFCAHVIESVTAALSAAHAEKILHRDVKPENIMITPQPDGSERIRLIDFGIARVDNSRLAPATESERSIGTVRYIAPEQLLGRLDQTPACDVYACATVAYEMLTNELPFKPNSLVEMFLLQEQGVKTPPRELRPEIPAAAEKIILQALAFDPPDRPSEDIAVFGRALAKALRQGAESKIQDDTNETNETSPTPASVINTETNRADNRSVVTRAAAPVRSADFSQINDSVAFSAENRKSGKNSVWLILGLVGLPVVLLLATFIWWKTSAPPASATINSNAAVKADGEKTVNAPPKISYYLNVQKMRDGKPFEAPFRATGREIFEGGYKFKMTLKSTANGYLYLFNEGKNAKGETAYFLLRPTSSEAEAAAVRTNQEVETGYYRFTNGRGKEIVWIIWTKQQNDALTAAKQTAFKEDAGGEIQDAETVRRLGEFLRQVADSKTEISKDDAQELTTVAGTGEVVVHRLELEHR